MERTLTRKLVLNTQELRDAVKCWLAKRDIPIGDDPLIEFVPNAAWCKITSTEEAQIELLEQE